MGAFITLLVFGVFFYVMMRFGCGAHLVHGDQCHHGKEKHNAKSNHHIDPVCGKSVDPDNGYDLMHHQQLHHFCSKHCLEQFEHNPEKYTNKTSVSTA